MFSNPPIESTVAAAAAAAQSSPQVGGLLRVSLCSKFISASPLTAAHQQETDGAIDADWCRKKMCCVMRRKLCPRPGGRIPGGRPIARDLAAARFLPLQEFKCGELVLVPRARGGLTYGVAGAKSLAARCYLDASVQHESPRFRVAYPSPSASEQLFKDMPPHYIGKIPQDPPSPSQQQQQADEFADPFATARLRRNVGARVFACDLANACFLPNAAFAVGQTVAVPRSSGGFTYGRVLSRHITVCAIAPDSRHEITGWRVLVAEQSQDSPRVFKDLPAGVIGKLVLLDEAPAPRPALLAPRPLSIERPQQQPAEVAAGTRDGGEQDEDEDEKEIAGEETILWNGGCGETDLKSPAMAAASAVPAEPDLCDGVEEDDSGSDQEAHRRSQGSTDDEGDVMAKIVQAPAPAAPARPVACAEKSPEATTAAAAAPQPPAPPATQQQGQKGGVFVLDLPHFAMVPKTATPGKPMIVIDGPNVGMKYAKKNHLSVTGLRIAINYYLSRGHDVVAFIPEHHYTSKPPPPCFGLKLQDFMPAIDDRPALEELMAKKLVVLTPPQDYDDSYAIQYARLHDACIVTNDRYWDHIKKKREDREARETKFWIRSHCISFTFVRDEFMPNPDFKWPIAASFKQQQQQSGCRPELMAPRGSRS